MSKSYSHQHKSYRQPRKSIVPESVKSLDWRVAPAVVAGAAIIAGLGILSTETEIGENNGATTETETSQLIDQLAPQYGPIGSLALREGKFSFQTQDPSGQAVTCQGRFDLQAGAAAISSPVTCQPITVVYKAPPESGK